ncbi:MAG TPA: glycosyltransferase family 39 protein [Candidatus Binatia bacterium]|nr:glycosyltransferase family 39 protein [Candidatus Binatia bacterium]
MSPIRMPSQAVEVNPAGAKAGFLARSAVAALCLTLLIGIGIVRIVSTYRVFNHTIDEPSHLACGLEWWEKGVYRIETKHPPLARISIAALPYMSGLRAPAEFKSWQETYPVLSADGHYWRNLWLARIGVLPYYVICTLVVFFWTRRLFGTTAGLLAAAVFSMAPPVLAHSAVATTDVPLAAMFCWALYAFTLWLERPDWRRAAALGVASGLAVATKFSTLLFLPACAVAILALYLVGGGQRNWRVLLRTAVLAALCALLSIWAVYRFSHAPLAQVTAVPDRLAARAFGSSSPMTAAVHKIAAIVPIPAPELIDGVRVLRQQNNEGTRSYLLGRIKEGGFWYFFVVALALKTPLAALILGALGAVAALGRYSRDHADWQIAAPLASAIMILVITAPAGMNSGVRHVLPEYVFLSIYAGLGMVALWRRSVHATLYRALAVMLLSWMTLSSAIAHPDYLAYFNEFGGSDPSRLLVISDLDWGQDLTRLAKYLRENHIDHISIAYEGFYDPASLDLPETVKLKCGDMPTGWVAVAARRARRSPECEPWLQGHQRVTIVGKTMWIYNIPANAQGANLAHPVQ